MKHVILTILASLLILAGSKELRLLVLTPTPPMHCESCENNIKKNLRFEKGVVKIETNIDKQTVTVTYNAKKCSVANIQSAMKKIGYETKVVSDTPLAQHTR